MHTFSPSWEIVFGKSEPLKIGKRRSSSVCIRRLISSLLIVPVPVLRQSLKVHQPVVDCIRRRRRRRYHAVPIWNERRVE